MKKFFTVLFTLGPTGIIFAQEQIQNIPLEITLTAKIFLFFLFIVFLSTFFPIYYLNKVLKNYKDKSLAKPFFYIIFFVWLNFIIMSSICIFTLIFLPNLQSALFDNVTSTTIAVLTMIISLILAPIIGRRFFQW